jgi:hypothetical protein
MSPAFEIAPVVFNRLSLSISPLNICQIYAVDLNGDGNSDLLVLGAFYPFNGSPAAQPGYLLWGIGKGGFRLAAESEFPISALRTVHPREVSFADFNADGRLDICKRPENSS